MKECLQCKKQFEAKREVAKFCSVNCRVKWNRKNSVTRGVDAGQAQKIYDAIMDKLNGVAFVSPSKQSFDAPRLNKVTHDEPPQWATPKPKLIRSFDNYRELRLDCDTLEDWAELKAEILSATHLSQKQKILLTT